MSNAILFYSSPGCASCRKARRWLQDNKIPYIEKNIFSNMLSDAELRYLMTRCENGTDDIISTRSKAYAPLKGRIDDLPLSDLSDYVRKNPSILKRPILLSETSMVVGYDDDDITAIVPSNLRIERRKKDLAALSYAELTC